jgi:uncharacterized OB-fold protein
VTLTRTLDCARWFFYPRPFCPTCHGSAVRWRPVSGRATLASWVVVHRVPPGVTRAVPYVIALVELAEGPRLMTNVVGLGDPAGGELRVGQDVAVDFEARADDPQTLVPVFAPVAQAGA